MHALLGKLGFDVRTAGPDKQRDRHKLRIACAPDSLWYSYVLSVDDDWLSTCRAETTARDQGGNADH